MTTPLSQQQEFERIGDQDLVDLVEVMAEQRDRLTQIAIALVIAQIVAMENDSWYDHVEIRAFATRIVRFVEAAQRNTIALTDAYLTRALAHISGRSIPSVGLVKADNLRKGVQHDAVYGRLANSYRYLRSTGVEEEEAQSRVTTRASTMVDTDTLLAFRAQSERTLSSRKDVVGYRRIIHPELSRDGSCGLCIVASDRVYNKEDLLDIHDNCKCTVLPIVRVKGEIQDPGNDINQDDLKSIYASAGGNTAKKLKKVRIQTHEHGELGPVIGYRNQHFRTASDVRRSEQAA